MVKTADLESLRPRLFAQARKWGVSREEAEDATQSVLLKIWKKGEEVRPETLSAYASRILQREMLDRRRRAARHPEVLECELPEGATAHADLFADEAARRELRAVEDGAFTSPVMRAVMELPPMEASAILAIDVAEMATFEYAERAGISPSTVRVRVWRGRTRLRAALAYLN